MGRVAELGDMDVTTEEGYRQFTQNGVALMRDLSRDLEFVSHLVSTVLANTKTNDPKQNSRREARKVRGYIRRASQAQVFAASQIAGAFRVTENVFLPNKRKSSPQRGMRMTGNRQSA